MRRGGRTPRLKWTALAAILAIQASVTGAQGGQLLPPPNDEEIRRHGIFIDSFDVSLINVEVHVTRDGIPLTDLTVDDFEVLDDGQP
ncbi:MAG: hypothetical protein GY953_18980, partial [bacterium]|nr:hypothetical protein [bacterium]